MKIQELVYNRPNLIGPSQVGSISAFGCMLQFHIFFFFLQLMCVFSSVQAKSKTEQCQCAFKYHSRAWKRERECFNYVCVQFSVGLCQHIHICVQILCSCMWMCLPRGAYLCHIVCAGGEWGSVVQMLSRLQHGTAVVHVQCRKRQEQATYKLNGHTLKTFTLAGSSRAMKQAIDTFSSSCLVVNQNRKYKVFLGSFNTYFFQMNCYIYKIGFIPV